MTTLTLRLPPEFIAKCEADQVDPAEVLRGFVADLCELRSADYNTGGGDERMLADDYYNRRGYPYRHDR